MMLSPFLGSVGHLSLFFWDVLCGLLPVFTDFSGQGSHCLLQSPKILNLYFLEKSYDFSFYLL